ncbi:hypothetical protein RB195_007125 [Necator americanus]|uniref:Uncharacterized protein n=1 Tax=Necator americanus TaxID=51031 RepID=A0ABR1BYV0_NECAM
MEETGDPMWRMTSSRMSRRLTSTSNSTTTSYSFSFVAQEATTFSPLEWFTNHSRHVAIVKIGIEIGIEDRCPYETMK